MQADVQILSKTILVAAASARSKAYIQALVTNGLHPEKLILLSDERQDRKTEAQNIRQWQDIALPDLNESVIETCERASIPYEVAPAADVNAPATIDLIKSQNADTVICSVKGGQIVSEDALNTAKQFLHMHSGWLPEYRGSTTVYYALLNGDKPAVTAIFMDKTIDTGPIIAKREYPVPPPDLNIDLIYDCAIRADLMVRVMNDFVAQGEISVMEMQSPDKGSVYYVIHPVLKHIAILSLDDWEKENVG